MSSTTDPYERQRAEPNLWILAGITVLSLVITAIVLAATAL
jgi:hypothetical protein